MALPGKNLKVQTGIMELSPGKMIDQKRGERSQKIRVVIVEDDLKLLSTLSKLINTDPEFEVEGGFSTTAAALEGIPRLNPDIVIMDINLPDINGVECVRRLKPICPGPQILILTVYEDTEVIFSALRAGASGYLLKQTPIEELLTALREIARGGSPMSSHVARKVVQSFKDDATVNLEVESLSPREREVLELVAEGCLFKEIADKLGVSFGTIHTYCRRIYEKLHVRSRAQAVAKWHHK
jgi:DNA-binding NarL/FixJ family response regulator